MRNVLKHLIVVSTLALVLLPLAHAQNDALAGNWLAMMEYNDITRRLMLKIVPSSDGSLTAKLDSLDQGASDLPIDSVTREGETVRFTAKKLGLEYEGKINQKGDEITGNLKQGGGAFPLVFRRTAAAPALHRPQDPAKPYPYHEEEVSYQNEQDDVKLAGTLTLLRDGQRHPAVLLITGSGAQDRNETVAGHRPFLVLADALTRAGIAVLRVDDRGVGGSGGGSLSETSEDFAGDVLAGIEYLKTRKEINPKQIGLVGHSEGGMIAPMVAAKSKDVAFIVMLAGLGQKGADVILTQLAALQKKGGAQPEAILEAVDFQKSLLSIVISEPDNKLAEQRIGEMLARRKSPMNEGQLKAFARSETDVKAQLPLLLSPWYRFFISHDPRPTLEKIKIPVLALNGENDVQVSAKENLALIAAALEAAGNSDFTVTSLPNLNHLFQTSQTGLPNEYGEIEETISPQVLEAISDWVLKRTGKN